VAEDIGFMKLPSRAVCEQGELWTITALKWNREKHIEWQSHFVGETNGVLHFFTPLRTPIQHYSRQSFFETDNQSDLFFWHGEWFNVYMNYASRGHLRDYYCNVALPPEVNYEARTLQFIDLDLDVQIRWERLLVLDEHEFLEHSVKYQYPPEVQERARQIVILLKGRWKARIFPFDRDTRRDLP
jgi:protein associated with RNAse G/E